MSSDTESERAWQARHAAIEDGILTARARRAAARRRNAEKRVRAFGDLCEATEGLAVVWCQEGTPLKEMLAFAGDDAFTLHTLTRWLRLEMTRRIARLRHATRRPAYYEQEKARRQALAEERRRIARRTTENRCPTKKQILDAWAKVPNSNEDLLRFGSLIEDLACYMDSSLIRTGDGTIVGRRGGVKVWLQVNIPALYLRYTTVMRYKAAAKKLRQITELKDPVPAVRLVDAPDGQRTTTATKDAVQVDRMPKEQSLDHGADKDITVLRARAIYLEMMTEPPASRTAYLAQIDAYLDPERVEEATTLTTWKERYVREITVRSKMKWTRRLWRAAV